jgi:iron complex outermembrane receptor protein
VVAPFNSGPITFCTDVATTPNGCSASYEKKSSKPTWMIDLDFKPMDDMLLYAKYARGYRAGGVISNAPFDHRTFDPEKVDNFEVGLKAGWQGAAPGIFDLALFYNNFEDQQLQIGYNAHLFPNGATAPVAPTTAVLNAGKSRIYGAELEAAVTPLEGLTFDLNYTYLNTEIREIGAVGTIDANFDAAVAIRPGDPLVLSPKHKAVGTARYTLPLDKSIGPISVGLTYSYTSEQLTNYVYNNPAIVQLLGGNFGGVGSRNLVNADLGWASIFGSGVDVTAFGTNLTNKKYYTFIAGLGSFGSALELASIGEPRMYGVRLRYRFGQ